MAGCVLSQLKLSELSIPSIKKGRGRRPTRNIYAIHNFAIHKAKLLNKHLIIVIFYIN